MLFQPYEFVIIAGSSLGIFIVANATSTIKDCGKACLEAVLDKAPKPRDFLDVLSALHALMRELRAKARSEVEAHFDNPEESEIFRNFSKPLADRDLVTFICDYGRLIIIGNARTHEIEALMDEEIETLAARPVQAGACVPGGRRRIARARDRGRGSRHHPRHGRARSVAGNPGRTLTARRWSGPSPAFSCPTRLLLSDCAESQSGT